MNRLLQAETVASPLRELPIQFREGLLWVEVCVPQSKSPLHFLLDSGASASVVNLSTARRLGLELGPKVSVTAVATMLTGHWPVKLSAKASRLELPGEYLALDLSMLASACSCSVDGLIGADFFRDRVVEIDYVAQKLRVLDALPSDAGANAIPLEVRRCGMRVAVNVNGGKSQWVRVDTGCATAFQWVTSKERADKCTSKLAVGLAELSIPQTMTGLRIGNHYLDTVPTGLHRKAIFPGESGLLGNGLLADFGVVTIDAKAGRLFLGHSPAK
ncbi:MAG: retropepsin-like domain-containing protein [Verrucomicrobia bacterium]|nr:retropepsin-like domain-containing protein [Verrucomicrobiota bacterium]